MNKPYKILWWTIPIIILLILLGVDGSIDLQLHSSYFVVASLQVAIAFTLLLSISGGVYWLLRFYYLNSILSTIHSFGTSFCLIGIAFVAIFKTLSRTKNFELFGQLDSITIALILLLTSLQIIFIANSIIGLMRGVKA